jgi:hypothetical protein
MFMYTKQTVNQILKPKNNLTSLERLQRISSVH